MKSDIWLKSIKWRARRQWWYAVCIMSNLVAVINITEGYATPEEAEASARNLLKDLSESCISAAGNPTDTQK